VVFACALVCLSPSHADVMGILGSSDVNVTCNATDSTPPVLTGLVLTPGVVTSATINLVLNVTFTDASGVSAVYIEIYRENEPASMSVYGYYLTSQCQTTADPGNQCDQFAFISYYTWCPCNSVLSALPSASGAIDVRYLGVGTYLIRVALADMMGNIRYYSSEDLAGAGLPSSVVKNSGVTYGSTLPSLSKFIESVSSATYPLVWSVDVNLTQTDSAPTRSILIVYEPPTGYRYAAIGYLGLLFFSTAGTIPIAPLSFRPVNGLWTPIVIVQNILFQSYRIPAPLPNGVEVSNGTNPSSTGPVCTGVSVSRTEVDVSTQGQYIIYSTNCSNVQLVGVFVESPDASYQFTFSANINVLIPRGAPAGVYTVKGIVAIDNDYNIRVYGQCSRAWASRITIPALLGTRLDPCGANEPLPSSSSSSRVRSSSSVRVLSSSSSSFTAPSSTTSSTAAAAGGSSSTAGDTGGINASFVVQPWTVCIISIMSMALYCLEFL